MSQIFKVCYLNKNRIKKIFVFVGNKQLTDGTSVNDMNKLLLENPEHELFTMIFSKDELSVVAGLVKKDLESVVFVPLLIHIDDTVETIKKKLIYTNDNNIAFEEIYLFMETKEQIDSQKVYKNLTQNEKIELNRERFASFLSNVGDVDLTDVSDKSVYTYTDIIGLNLDTSEHTVKKTIGQKVMAEEKYPYSVNPFDLLKFDEFLTKYADTIISTENKNSLFDYGIIHNNTIYMCTTEDVFTNMEEQGNSVETACKLYFPFLYEYGIRSLGDFESNKIKLLDRNDKFIDTRFVKQITNVDMFYMMYDSKKEELPYFNKGIKNLHCVVHPNVKINIPLDTLFKLLHATRDYPLIKFNHSNRKEKIYRLYAEQTAKNGKKIPYLERSEIMKLKKSIGRSRCVAVYCKKEYKGDLLSAVMEIDVLGNVSIMCETEKGYTIDELNEFLKETCNPILKQIKEFLEISGYNFILFNSLIEKNVEIIRIMYFTQLSISKNISLQKIIGCASTIFNVVIDDIKKGTVLQFKRVSNYNEMDSQEAFIIEQLNYKKTIPEIISAMELNFAMSRELAEEKIITFLNDVQVEVNAFEGKRLRIKSNPGFPVLIKKEKFKNNLFIEIDKINDIHYLYTLPIFLDSILRITQKGDSTAINKRYIMKQCLSKRQKGVAEIKEIKHTAEKRLVENEQKKIEAQEWVAPDEEDGDDDFLDMMIDDEDEEEDEDGDVIMSGGLAEGEGEGEGDGDGEGESEDESDEEFIDEIIIDDDNIIDTDDSDEDDDEEIETGPIKMKIPSKVSEVSLSETLGSPSLTALESDTSISPDKQSIESIDNDDDDEEDDDKEEEELEKDIVGMSLANPYYFFDRMYKRDPALFLTKKEGKFNAYSRICPSNVRRQPVILTDKEKEKIDREHPGSYTETFKYGSQPDKQFWYICPRYWCLKDNVSLTQEEVNNGACGGKVIPFGKKKVTDGEYIYEFGAEEGTAAAKEWLDKDGQHVTHYPGFVKEGSHPDDLGIPCCFKSWDGPEQERRRKVFLEKKVVEKKKIENEDYIKGPEKYPLQQGRYGYLPIVIQKFLHTDNKKCQISEINKNIKPLTTCYLRSGVENHPKKHFIGAIAYIYNSEPHMIKKTGVTINEMIEVIIDAISIDDFVKYQNGNLVETFAKKDSTRSVDVEKYKSSALYEKFANEAFKQSLNNMVAAYENFQTFLRDDNEYIDYTYLWDIITTPNPKLFASGMNLFVLRIPNDDITDNVEVVCPTNAYSSQKFNDMKATLVLVQQDNVFEPVVVYKNLETRISIRNVMRLRGKSAVNISPAVRSVLISVGNLFNTKCIPLKSRQEYKFRSPLTLDKMIELLGTTKRVDIEKLVVNYNNKVIGLKVNNKKISGFLPCKPSSTFHDYPTVTMDDEDIFTDYKSTIELLNFVKMATKDEIPCKPVIKILEDELIVGILTETNQFVMLTEPQENSMEDELIEIKDTNYFIMDQKIHDASNKDKDDKERKLYVKRIKLETRFYTVFRNLCKTKLNEYENRELRRTIEEIVHMKHMTYSEKIQKVFENIQLLISDHIEFVNYTDKIINEIDEVTKCINISADDCKERKFCMTVDDSESGNCKLLVPKTNLINKKDNESGYFMRLADEIIRYGQIRTFLFKPQSYMSLEKVDYKLKNDEIILLDSLLNIEYFDYLVLQENEKYAKFKTYDTAQPLQSLTYVNNEKLNEILKPIDDVEEKMAPTKKLKIKKPTKKTETKDEIERSSDACILLVKGVTRKAVTGKISELTPKRAFELKYKDKEACTFNFIIQVLKEYMAYNESDVREKERITTTFVKNVLVEEYTKLINKNKTIESNIVKIFRSQQKNSTMLDSVETGEITMEVFILSEENNITLLDIWILALRFNVPVMLITSTKFAENSDNVFVTKRSSDNTYIVIRQHGVLVNKITNYSFIGVMDGKKPNYILPMEGFKKDVQEKIESQTEIPGEERLTTFITTYKKKRRVVKLVKKGQTKLK